MKVLDSSEGCLKMATQPIAATIYIKYEGIKVESFRELKNVKEF